MKTKLAVILGIAIAVIVLNQPAMASSVADNSQVAETVTVPDATATLPLLGLGVLALCSFRRRLSSVN